MDFSESIKGMIKIAASLAVVFPSMTYPFFVWVAKTIQDAFSYGVCAGYQSPSSQEDHDTIISPPFPNKKRRLKMSECVRADI